MYVLHGRTSLAVIRLDGHRTASPAETVSLAPLMTSTA